MLYNKFIDEQIIEIYYVIKHRESKLHDDSIQLILDYIFPEPNVLRRLKKDYHFSHVKYVLGSIFNHNKDNLIELY